MRYRGCFPAIHVQADVRRTRLIGTTHVYEGGVMIVRARDPIYRMKDLKGKKIGLSKSLNLIKADWWRIQEEQGIELMLMLNDMTRDDVEIVGTIPAGLAPPKWPEVGLQNWWLLFPGAVGLALVNFAEAIGPARSFAASHKYKMEPNQELIGLGAANFGAGLFQGFPIGSSLSKSAANDRAGAHSQMSGIIAAGVTVLVALFFTQFFYALPEAALGAIVIVAVSGMLKFVKIRHLYQVRRADFILAVVALLAVLTFETLEALLIAVVVSLFALVWRASHPRLAVLGRAPDSLQFSDIHRHPENATVPGLLMVRPENGLFFANAAAIREAIIDQATSSAGQVKAVLLDLGATTDLDVPSADMVGELSEELHSHNVRFMLMRMITPVRQMLEQAGVMEKINPQDIFIGPTEAVLDYLASQYDDAGILSLLSSGASEVHSLLEASLATAPPERQAALIAIAESVGKGIQPGEMEKRQND